MLIFAIIMLLCFWCGVAHEELKNLSTPKRIALITGGAGFVGRHFSHRLCNQGFTVIVIDNLTSEGSLHPSAWPKHLKCNDDSIVFENIDCRRYFENDSHEPIELFIHLAAVVGGRAKIENQPLEVADDLSLDAAAFQFAAKVKPDNVVYFSSSAAYPIEYQGPDSDILLDESMITVHNGKGNIGFPDLSYGWAKLTGEYLSFLLRDKFSIPVSIYRPFSGYGEDQSDVYPFKSLVKQVYIKKKELNENFNLEKVGEDFFLWSNATRDFVYIEDIVDCVLHTYPKKIKEPMNLATGIPTSMHEIINVASKVAGFELLPNVQVLQGKPAGVAFRVGSPNKIHEYGCQFPTSIYRGIEIAYEYLKIELENEKQGVVNINSI